MWTAVRRLSAHKASAVRGQHVHTSWEDLIEKVSFAAYFKKRVRILVQAKTDVGHESGTRVACWRHKENTRRANRRLKLFHGQEGIGQQDSVVAPASVGRSPVLVAQLKWKMERDTPLRKLVSVMDRRCQS